MKNNHHTSYKSFLFRALLVAAVLVYCLTNTMAAQALSESNLERIYTHTEQYVANGDTNSCAALTTQPSATAGSTTPGGTLAVLGDSITVGMRDHGDMATELNAKGWVTSNANIIAVGGKDIYWGRDQVNANRGIIDSVDTVLVGLGTNNLDDPLEASNPEAPRKDRNWDHLKPDAKQVVKTAMQALVDSINPPGTANPKKIYWTSIFIKGMLNTQEGHFNMDLSMPVINEALNEVAAENNFAAILPWATSAEAPVLTADDGIHPSGKYPEMAKWVAEQLTNPGASQPVTASGCSCGASGGSVSSDGSRDQNYKAAWAFFTGKGLSPEATAGIMGNLEAESGINPQNTQNNAPAEDGPEIPIDKIRGSYGYGIAQWTSSGRQQNLIDYAKETSRSTGDIGLQLDFLWKELSERYTGVLTELQTPDITVDQATFVVLSEFEIPAPFTPGHSQAERDATTAGRQTRSQAIFAEFSGQSIATSSGGGCNSAGVNVDLASEDTSGVPCDGTSTTIGPALGHNNGKTVKIMLCDVNGAKLNSQIAGSVAQMISDADAAGLKISIGDNFRTIEEQEATYRRWCKSGGLTATDGPYPLPDRDDYQKCPGGAPPGYSNHEMGLAMDLMCNGSGIPMAYSSAQNNPCFIWLVANAEKYGLYEFSKGQNRSGGGYEAWHWSVDGG